MGYLPQLFVHQVPDDPDFILALIPYDIYRDSLMNPAEEIEKSQRRSDIQLSYRRSGDADQIQQEMMLILDRLMLLMPYSAASGGIRLTAVYVKMPPRKLSVDRHNRILYVASIRLVYNQSEAHNYEVIYGP